MQIIGQDKLISWIDSCTLDTFPHSFILEGEEGSGRHIISKYIAEHLNLEWIDITDNISFDTINEIMLKPQPCVYFIEGAKLTDRQENALLKFLEEPTKNAFIIMSCNSLSQLKPTVINRCESRKLIYSYSDLYNFCHDDKVVSIVRTPGQVIKLRGMKYEEIDKLCNTIIDRIAGANYPNVLTITDKIAFDRDANGYDFDCFIGILFYNVRKRLIEADGEDYFRLFKLYAATQDLNYYKQTVTHIDCHKLMDNYLTEIKLMMMYNDARRV